MSKRRLAGGIAALTIGASVMAQPMSDAVRATSEDIGARPMTLTPKETAFRIDEPARIRLARRYAPMVWLARGDDHGPMSAHTFIDYSALMWAHDSSCNDHSAESDDGLPTDPPREAGMGNGDYHHWDAADPASFPPCKHQGNRFYSDESTVPKTDEGPPGREGFFLDLDTDMQEGGGTGSPVYVQRFPHAIMYWFLYGYNDSTDPFNHEGDWERVAVRLTRTNKPFRVTFWRHGHTCYVRWRGVRKFNGHPVVFSAEGRHASYARTGSHDTPGPDDITSRGKRWMTWNNFDYVNQQAWWGYGGGWGDVGSNNDTTGPGGPSPLRGTDGLRTDDRC